jgi:DNA-directed RNA polymerase specialized sigma24 family protein
LFQGSGMGIVGVAQPSIVRLLADRPSLLHTTHSAAWYETCARRERPDRVARRHSSDWAVAPEDTDDTKQWQDDWDDDNVTGDFSQALRAELAKVTPPQQ